MGIACRVFFVDDNDSLQRIPMARLDRLLHFDRRETLQEYAGKCMGCAMVFLEVVGRQVLSKEKFDNHVIRFYKNNKINFSTSLKT